MCGRYAATANPDELIEEFDIDFVDGEMAEVCLPRYNIAPTDTIAGVVERTGDDDAVTRKLVPLRWGLVPSWSKKPTAAMINARVETLVTKPAFRKAAAARRCLLPAAGYYEWLSVPGPDGRQVKQPWFLHPGDGTLAMAGLYEFWKGPDGWLASATIITCQSTDAMGWVHDRMPMTVPADSWDDWLDPALVDAAAAVSLLTTPTLDARKVSRAVNTVGNEGAELISPLPE